MTEHGNNTATTPDTRIPMIREEELGRGPDKGDLVVDMSGIQKLDVTSLALLLTAQQNAQEDHRAVWLAGVPLHVWQRLHGMGLGRFFKPFPVDRERVD